MSDYKPLTDAELAKHAVGTTLFPETHQRDLIEQARRANALAAAVGAGLADVQYSIEHDGWPDRAGKTLKQLQEALAAYLGETND